MTLLLELNCIKVELLKSNRQLSIYNHLPAGMQVSSWESQGDLGSSQESSLPLPPDSLSVRLGQFIEHLKVAGIVLGTGDSQQGLCSQGFYGLMGKVSLDANTITLFVGDSKSESGSSHFPGKEK